MVLGFCLGMHMLSFDTVTLFSIARDGENADNAWSNYL